MFRLYAGLLEGYKDACDFLCVYISIYLLVCIFSIYKKTHVLLLSMKVVIDFLKFVKDLLIFEKQMFI